MSIYDSCPELCDDAYRMWKRAVQRSADWIEH